MTEVQTRVEYKRISTKEIKIKELYGNFYIHENI